MFTLAFPRIWMTKFVTVLLSALSYIVFLILDLIDPIFCLAFRVLDSFIEGQSASCYCEKKREDANGDAETELSDTLYERKNVFRNAVSLGFPRKWKDSPINDIKKKRWSDCSCKYCSSSMDCGGDQKLHVVTRGPFQGTMKESNAEPIENVIFLHGFLCSSSFWTETIFPNLSKTADGKYRLFAVDLLGFGKSPTPKDCFYTLRDHTEAIARSVIDPYHLKSFHLVAHSMGCIVALALAAKYSKSVKSVVLVAPPYIPSGPDASIRAMEKLAKKTLWPPLSFGSAFMSWYEHLGRCVCLLVCRNHRLWEWILRKLTLNRDLSFEFVDFTKHTHHSAWHSMHNVICGGAKLADSYLEVLGGSGVKISVIQGDRDQVVPLESSFTIERKLPKAEVKIVRDTDHRSVILGRSKEFAQDLERVWSSSASTSGKRYSSNGSTCIK